MGTRTGEGTGTRIEKMVEGRETLGTFGVVTKMGRKTRKGATPTSSQQPQPQNPTSQRDRCIMRRTKVQGRQARDRTGEGGGEAKKRKKNSRLDVGNGGDLGRRRKKHGQEGVGSVDVDQEDLENTKRIVIE